MKNHFLTLLFTCCAMIACAQNESNFQQHQFSINASSFVKNFLSFNSNSAPNQPYQFMYRHLSPTGKAIRAQLGLNFFQNTSKQDDDVSELTLSSTDLALGFEKRNTVNNRWLYYFGGQMMFNYQIEDSKNSSGGNLSVSENILYQAGVAGIIGIQYNINDRISLGTEGGLPILYSSSKDKITVQNTIIESTEEFVTIAPMLPNSLFLNITF